MQACFQPWVFLERTGRLRYSLRAALATCKFSLVVSFQRPFPTAMPATAMPLPETHFPGPGAWSFRIPQSMSVTRRGPNPILHGVLMRNRQANSWAAPWKPKRSPPRPTGSMFAPLTYHPHPGPISGLSTGYVCIFNSPLTSSWHRCVLPLPETYVSLKKL